MIKSLLFISIAPIIIVALYVYIRDKYEKEPIGALIKALLSGVIIVFPIVFIEDFLMQYKPSGDSISTALYTGFVSAASSFFIAHKRQVMIEHLLSIRLVLLPQGLNLLLTSDHVKPPG